MISENLLSDQKAMMMALALARRGSGFTRPNPIVGALVVKDGRIVGRGWHRAYGQAHAEVEAINQAGDLTHGATLYVTLEPCNHQGRTGPCTEAIIAAGIKRVVIAMRDPNPTVQGNGMERLQQAGVQVELGLCEFESKLQNALWLHWITSGRPLVVAKLAASANGRLAHPKSGPRWISSAVARAQVQRLRRHFDAVLVGSGTIRADDPLLTNRSGYGPQPTRLVVDSDLSTALDARVYDPTAQNLSRTIVITREDCPFEKRTELERRGVRVKTFGNSSKGVDLEALVKHLGESGVQGVLCESGPRVLNALLQQGLCNALVLYRSPVEIDDELQSLPQLEESAYASIEGGFHLHSVTTLSSGERREIYFSNRLRF